MSKPPLGLTPRYVHEARRASDIIQAMQRYLHAEKEIPREWVKELLEMKSVVEQ